MVIHGMSGIGKTTLAKAIFNKLSAKFDNACFLEDVPESSCRDLQERLLQGLDPKSIGRSNFSRDIKERFYKRKVLIVLDDVEEWEQIDKLAGKLDWFGVGSRIIVTSRNRDVLNRGAPEEAEVLWFEMKTLNEKEAEALFCWFAFRMNNPSVGFEWLSREIVQDAEGLPLYLKVIGASLYKKDEEVWRDVLSKLKKVPAKNVAERLKISYDALEDDEQKFFFLDIACLSSITNDRRKAVNMWEACDLYPHAGLDILSSMSLIRVENNSIRMHSQLKYLGKKIVLEENDPNKRSRLWDHKEAIQVLMSMEGKEKVEVLVTDASRGITLSNEHFASCRELRFLQMTGAIITGDFKNLLPNLKWLSWKYCPAILSATNLSLKNLVNLDLSRSFIDDSWGGGKLFQDMNHLKDLNLSYCGSLTITPKFSKNNSLERLVLSNCSKLREIDGSIGKLGKLKYLDLKYCDSLGGLPEEIGCLVNLETLCVSGSSHVEFKLPNSIGCLKSLTTLKLVGFSVSNIPKSIGGLTKLQFMELETCAEVLPESLGDLQSLVRLELSTSKYCKLPKSLGRLVKLEYLWVTEGMNFDELLESLGNLQELKAVSLWYGLSKKIPESIGKLKKLEYLHLQGVLEEVPTEVFGLPSLRELKLWASSFSTLPSTFSQLKLLTKLDLGTNHMLQELPDLPLSLSELSVSSSSLRKIPNLSRLVNLTKLKLLAADDYGRSKEILDDSNCSEGGIEKLIKLEELYLGIATAQKILQFDLCSLAKIKFTLNFMPYLEDSDARPLLLPSAASSLESYVSSQRRLDLKFPNLSTLKNLRKVVFRNCLVKDGLDRLGIQHMENVDKVAIVNCSAELIELTFQIKNLSYLKIDHCGSFKTLRLSTLSDLRVMYICNLEDLVEITWFGSHVHILELNINDCTSLERLNLSKLESISIINLYGCPKVRTIQGTEGLFPSYLSLNNCGSLKTLPDLSKLKNLTSLGLGECKEAVEITGLGSLVSLFELDIEDCESLERLENLSKLENLSRITLWDCPKLRTIEGIEGLFLSWLMIQRCGSLQNRDEIKKRCTEDAHIYMD